MESFIMLDHPLLFVIVKYMFNTYEVELKMTVLQMRYWYCGDCMILSCIDTKEMILGDIDTIEMILPG